MNSEFAFVVDRRRNNLGHKKANKLVSIFHNLRMLQRMNKTSYTEPAVAWTENVESSSGITRYGIDNYEYRLCTANSLVLPPGPVGPPGGGCLRLNV